MKKKGFTLVELLAVIVILAIIALIAIPLIGNVIEKAKIGALEASVNGLVESANMYYANNTIKGETISETVFDFEDGEQVSDKKLEYKGKVYNGKLILHANGQVAVCIDDNEHYAYKNKDSDEIVSGRGSCYYDGTTGDFSSNSLINDLRGKTLVATDITESEDGLNAIITIPEEGHYDGNSKITVPIETIVNEVPSINATDAVPVISAVSSQNGGGYITLTFDTRNIKTMKVINLEILSFMYQWGSGTATLANKTVNLYNASGTKLGTMTLPAVGVEFTVSDDTAYMTYSGYTCGTSSTCGALFTQQIVKA